MSELRQNVSERREINAWPPAMPPFLGGSVVNDLIPNVGAGTLLEQTLLADDRAVRVGAIQTLDYEPRRRDHP